jgi:fluoride exporter
LSINILLTIFLGGGLGSVTRFALAKWVSGLHSHHFPYGTLIINVVACLLLGLVIGLADHRQMLSPTARAFWAVGFCGGFSTFSTFSNETLGLLQQGYTASGFLYMLSSVVFCLFATFCGLLLAGKL